MSHCQRNRATIERIASAAFWEKSYRDFKAWVRPGLKPPTLPDADIQMKGDKVLLDGKHVMTLDVEPQERDFLGKLLKAGYQARKGNCLAHVVAVYDEGEARAIDRYLKELRAKK
jgi:hypothetical protein